MSLLIAYYDEQGKAFRYVDLESWIKDVRVRTKYLIRHRRNENGSPTTEERIYTITSLGRIDDHPYPELVSFEIGDVEAKSEAHEDNRPKLAKGRAGKGKKGKGVTNLADNATTKTVLQHYNESESNWMRKKLLTN
jgi:hypothetical protein